MNYGLGIIIIIIIMEMMVLMVVDACIFQVSIKKNISEYLMHVFQGSKVTVSQLTEEE